MVCVNTFYFSSKILHLRTCGIKINLFELQIVIYNLLNLYTDQILLLLQLNSLSLCFDMITLNCDDYKSELQQTSISKIISTQNLSNYVQGHVIFSQIVLLFTFRNI